MLTVRGRKAMEHTSNSAQPGHQQVETSALPSRSFGQVRGFDGLRGVAVLTIFVAHLDVILPLSTLLLIPGATVSLDAFFVLSGFLITALLLKEQARRGRIGIVPFYRRRVLRLLPALYVVVLANALFAYATRQWFHTEVPSILSVLFYYSNYLTASASSPLNPALASGFQHMWSLSFEEQFYFVWPWVTIVLLTARTSFRTVVAVLLSLIALIAIHRFVLYQDTGRWWSILYRTDTRADSILWGALLAHIWIRNKEPKRGVRLAGWVAAVFLLACLVFSTEYGPFVFRGGFVAVDAACAVLLLAILDGRWGGRHLFELKPFVALGIVSYGFYLWHLPVFFAIRYFDPHWSDVLRVVVAVLVTLLLTILSWFLLERPLMRWSKRLEAKRNSLPEAPDPGASPGDDAQPGTAGMPSPEINGPIAQTATNLRSLGTVEDPETKGS
jgi:peptidoglycan/LPS O-acetylase OafA/YrhL